MRGRASSAEQLWSAAVEAGERGKRQRALKLLRACVETGDRDFGGRASATLAEAFLGEGEPAKARQVLAWVVEPEGNRQTSEGVLQATVSMGLVSLAEGDTDGAEARFRQVMASSSPTMAAIAAYNLGTLLPAIGDLDGAREALRSAVDSRDMRVAPRASINLGIVLTNLGDSAGAQVVFEATAAGPDTEHAALARLHLLGLRERDLPPGVFSTPFPQDLDLLQDLEPGSAAWHGARHRRIGELRLQGSRLTMASLRRRDDRGRQLDRYVSLVEIADRIAGLAQTPEELTDSLEAYVAASRIGDALAARFPNWLPGWTLGMYVVRRLGDLHTARSAVEDARACYERVYAQAVEISRAVPASVMGPFNAGRACRKLAELEELEEVKELEETGAESRRTRLAEATSWSDLARQRQPADVDTAIEHCMNLWRLSELDTTQATTAASFIVDTLAPLDAAGNLPPAAAQPLAWARSVTAS